MKRKIIAAILLLVLAPLAIAAPYIQDSSIMTCAQLVAAGGTCANLPSATKSWSPSLSETVEAALVNGDVGKNLRDSTFKVVSTSDFTKIFNVNLTAAATGTTTTVFFQQSANRSVTIPNANTTLVGRDTTDTLLNKTLGTTGMTGFLTLVGDPVSVLQAATKQYVDNGLAQLNPLTSVYAASTANFPGVYTTVGSCIADFFTLTATGAFSIDGVNPPIGSRILLKNQGAAAQNGVYNLTVVGALGVSPVLTRALDYDTSADINAGNVIPVIFGTANALTSWVQVNTITTCAVDNVSFTEWTQNPSSYASSTLTNTHILVGSAANVATDVAMSGDATLANTGALTIANNAVTNAKLAQMAANSIKGNNTGGVANAIDLTATQTTAMLNNFVGDAGAGGTKGLVPAPGAGDAAAGKFLKADGTFAVPGGGGSSTPFESFNQVGGVTISDDFDGMRVVDQARTISNVICALKNTNTSAVSTFVELDYGPTLNHAITLPVVANGTYNYASTAAAAAVTTGDLELMKVISVAPGAPEDLTCKVVY